MDYKDLIKLLRRTVEHGDEEPREYCTNRCGGCELCDQAADAIETLLAERDAAVKELRGICWCCVNGRPMGMIGRLRSCTTCDYMAERGMLGVVGREKDCPHWQWRGPQKEGGA